MTLNVKSQYYLDKYYKFIGQCRTRIIPEGEYTEKHHIEPVALFPELEKEKSNIVVLRAREHYLAHWMLAKAYSGSMWYAFNQMKRILPNTNQKKSSLYEMSRKYIAQLISETNSGRCMSEANKELMSVVHTGMVNARDKHGDVHRVCTTDSRFETGEFINARTGQKHTNETKELMSINGVKNRLMYTDGSRRVYIADGGDIPLGFYLGAPEKASLIAKENFTDAKHYYNPCTGERIRSKIHPGGDFVEGRIDGYKQGNSIMNDPSKIKVYDVSLQKIILINKMDKSQYHLSIPTTSKIIISFSYIFESMSLFGELFPEFPVRSEKIPQPNPKQSKERWEFCKLYQGKTKEDFNISSFVLGEWKGDYTQYTFVTKENRDSFDITSYRQYLYGHNYTKIFGGSVATNNNK